MAFGVFGTNPISDLLTSVISYLPRVFAAILIIVVASAIAAAARELLDATLSGLSYGPGVANGVGVAVLTVGAFAALNQLQVAPDIVNGLFYALLAIVAGVTIIAVGGGGIAPMRARWENALSRMDDELPRVREARRREGTHPTTGSGTQTAGPGPSRHRSIGRPRSPPPFLNRTQSSVHPQQPTHNTRRQPNGPGPNRRIRSVDRP